MPVLAAGEKQIDQVIAFGAGRRGILYLTDRRLVFEWSEGLVAKRNQQLGIALSEVLTVTAAHSAVGEFFGGGRELVISTKSTQNGFHSNRISIGIAMAPEVWMSKINSLLFRFSPQAAAPKVIEREVVEKEVVKIPCKYCGALVDMFRARTCPNCGAPLH